MADRNRTDGKLISRTLALGWLLMMAAFPLTSAAASGTTRTPDIHRVVDNVVFDLWSTIEGMTGCLRTTNGATLNGTYGVTIAAVVDPSAWQDPLPKVITVVSDDFALPLRIELRRNRGFEPSPVRIEVGACLAGGMCVPVTLNVPPMRPRGSARNIAC
jgi:hypothetical protein